MRECQSEFKGILMLTACLQAVVAISSILFVHGVNKNRQELIRQWLLVILGSLLASIFMQMFLLRSCWRDCNRVMAATVFALMDAFIVGEYYVIFLLLNFSRY